MNKDGNRKLLYKQLLIPIIVCILVLGFFVENVVSVGLTMPGTPTLLVGAVQDNKVPVTVGWTGSAGDVKGYKVYRGPDAQNLTLVGTTENLIEPLTFADSVDQTAVKYYYYVTAYDQNGVESPSSDISATYVSGPNASLTPGQDQVVSIKPMLQAAFDQDVDPLTVNKSTVVIKDAAGTALVGTVVTYDSTQRKARLSIWDTLLPNEHYVLEVSTGVKNTSGLVMSSVQSVNFTTQNSTNYPHGNYNDVTDQCSTCHGTHQAKNLELLKTATVNETCFVCHNGTQVDLSEVFGDASYQTTGHFDGQDPAVKSDCSLCHSSHGTDNLKLLSEPYDMEVLDTKTSYGAADQFFCANTNCHPDLNPLTADSATSFKDSRQDPVLNLHYKHLVNSTDQGNAVCYECHRPHGPVAAEIEGVDLIVDPDLKQVFLDQMKLVGFPSTSTVLPALGNSSPKFVPSQDPDTVGGGCVLSCHGVVHDVASSHEGAIDSRYEFTP